MLKKGNPLCYILVMNPSSRIKILESSKNSSMNRRFWKYIYTYLTAQRAQEMPYRFTQVKIIIIFPGWEYFKRGHKEFRTRDFQRRQKIFQRSSQISVLAMESKMSKVGHDCKSNGEPSLRYTKQKHTTCRLCDFLRQNVGSCSFMDSAEVKW